MCSLLTKTCPERSDFYRPDLSGHYSALPVLLLLPRVPVKIAIILFLHSYTFTKYSQLVVVSKGGTS
jgi:hypothetical protein